MSHNTTSQTRPEKIGWGQAVHEYFFTKEGAGIFMRVMFILNPFIAVGSLADDGGDIIPGVNLLTIADNLPWWVVFPTIFLLGLTKHRTRRNRELKKEFLYEQRQAQQAYMRAQQPRTVY